MAVVNERMAVLPLSQTSIPPPTIIMPLFDAMCDYIKKREEPDGEIREQVDVMAIQVSPWQSLVVMTATAIHGDAVMAMTICGDKDGNDEDGGVGVGG